MNDEKNVAKIQEDDLMIVELDSRFDMTISDPLGLSDIQPIIITTGTSGCGNINCECCC